MIHSLTYPHSQVCPAFVSKNLGIAWEQGYTIPFCWALELFGAAHSNQLWVFPGTCVISLSSAKAHKWCSSISQENFIKNSWHVAVEKRKMQVWLLLTVTVILEPATLCFMHSNGKDKFRHSCTNVVWLLFVCIAYFYRSRRCCSYTVTWNFTHNFTARFSSCDGHQIQYSAD